MASIKLIVGLGNHGSEYEKTRHNVGAWFVEKLAHRTHQILRKESKFFGLVATAIVESQKIHLLFPTTYMNESGKAVAAMVCFYKIAPAEILVAHDELDFPAGKVRLKDTGGHGGHNGLRDIIKATGTKDFYRLRLGIGHPGHKDKVTPYVLGQPSKSDQLLIDNSIDDSLRIVDDIINGEFEKAMRYLHA